VSFANADNRSAPVPVINRLDALPDRLKGGVVAIGNFDGVHRGHQAVLEAAMRMAGSGSDDPDARKPVLAMTFEPHPRSFFQPSTSIFRLTPPLAKAHVLAALGVDAVIELPFDGELASVSAEDFVATILVNRLKITGAVVGWDFHFGHKRQGSPAFLVDAGMRHGFAVQVVPHFDDEGGVPVSSSRIRDALAEGDLGLANGLLGYRWFVEGEIVDGDKRGRELNFPTANMKLGPDCRLKHGVYAVTFSVDGVTHMGAASYGRRPQFDNGAPVLETYVLDFSGDLYGKTVRVGFVAYLRPELKFDSVDGLVTQMAADCAESRAILSAIDPGSVIDRRLAEGMGGTQP
jgi:riboflavin kinase/FMN adenylyltransferase